MKAVHFGAGNIGRGFVGLILHDAGYELVFADVNAELIEALAAAPSYAVHEVGLESTTRTVDNFRALNSSTQAAELVGEIASADIVTTAVGPGILRFIAPHIVEGLRLRRADAAPLQVMACENAINATDMLRDAIEAFVEPSEWTELAPRAIFANTAVDRIVPGQAPDAGLDVTVETFFEWVIEREPFGDAVPAIAAANFVNDLEPYIERKLFTVNTGHATVAYLGFVAGFERLDDALGDASVAAGARLVLEETSALLVQKHGLDPEAQRAYREKILVRFANPHLPDTVTRVGRQPVRKLSRHERFIGPAAEAAENHLPVDGLLAAIAAALRFDVPADEQSVELQRLLETETAASITESLCGIEATHPLFERLRAVVEARQVSDER